MTTAPHTINKLIKVILSTMLAMSTIFWMPFAQAEKLTIERIFDSPAISGPRMRGLEISPDGKRVTFLKGKDSDFERLDLWEYEISSGKTQLLFDADDLSQGQEKLSDEEKARRERLRLRGSGIVSYQWSKDGRSLLFPLDGDVYYFQLGDKKASKIIDTPEFETDVRFSPKGNYISFIREQNIFYVDVKTGKETQLTFDGKGPIKNGMAEFVAQEEMDRMTGYWWAPDESKIAFTRVNESPVAEVTRNEIYADEIKLIKQRYPFAGEANVTIQLAVVNIQTGKHQWVDLGENTDFYLPRVKWTNNANRLTYQWQSRDQKQLKLIAVNLDKNIARLLIEEVSKTWVNLHDDLHFLKDNSIIWSSERDGFRHIYHYSKDGELIKQLTQGSWTIDKISYIDQDQQRIYFTGRKDSPLERHLYSVSFNGGDMNRITSRVGFHTITFSPKGNAYIDNYSSTNTPPKISLHSANGERVAWLLENKVDQNHPLYPFISDWITPEYNHIKNENGDKLFYRLYKPKNFDAEKQYPVIVYLYGGPHAQLVTKRWGNFWSQYMAQQGYVVFTLDNRGSNYRGKAFEDPLYRAMGQVEVMDQITGVKFLHEQPWVDPERVGVYGHSYGGYMTLMAMFQAPKYFKVGVSGAPVTDWLLYDTHYTERYMGNPKEVPEAYQKSSVFPYVNNNVGPLLIMHGMADDNVLFKNSTKLYKLMQDKHIPFYVMDYPGEKHGISGKGPRVHRYKMIQNFFDLHLKSTR